MLLFVNRIHYFRVKPEAKTSNDSTDGAVAETSGECPSL
jgi:hypothetical protein